MYEVIYHWYGAGSLRVESLMGEEIWSHVLIQARRQECLWVNSCASKAIQLLTFCNWTVPDSANYGAGKFKVFDIVNVFIVDCSVSVACNIACGYTNFYLCDQKQGFIFIVSVVLYELLRNFHLPFFGVLFYVPCFQFLSHPVWMNQYFDVTFQLSVEYFC